MSGIVFYGTGNLELMRGFYRERLGLSLLLEQADCLLLQQGNLVLGFCARAEIETSGIICFVCSSPEEVDTMYHNLAEKAEDRPRKNERYGLYHFFARDPEGRRLEFQYFLQPVTGLQTADELLRERRSVRQFTEQPLSESHIMRVLELCRWAPSARNQQPCLYTVIRNRDLIDRLAQIRDRSSSPIGRAPVAVAVSADPALSNRFIQDSCIAATYLILAAETLGLGSCWIADMDRDEIKELLGLPLNHYIATVTPLGFPLVTPAPPERNPAENHLCWVD
jgi:nitroreductase